MLTPEYLKQMPDYIQSLMEDLEDDIIADISRRISKNLELTETADYQIEMLYRMGHDIDEIEKNIASKIGIAEKELEKILQDAANLSYENDERLYREGGKQLPKIDNNPRMKDFIEATIKNSKEDILNFTNTTGFVHNREFNLLDKFYRDTLNTAVLQVGSGAFDYNTVLRQSVKKLGDSGIRTIDYKSGRSYHIESAVRMNLLTAMNQITGEMSLMNADLMGQDLMEITAHMGARPSHADWQGQIISRSGRSGYLSLTDIEYGDVTGFQGANCRHGWFPYFEGISIRAYTDEYLENIDPEPFEFDGRMYTAYEASQKQRQLERNMRQTKRQLIAYDNAGLKDDFTAASIKLRRQRELYSDFSQAANLREKVERTSTYGYNRSVSSKSIWADRKKWSESQFSTEKSFIKHFNKHINEYGEISKEEYLNKARELLSSPIGGNIEGFSSGQGFTFKYNKTTNDFAIGRPDGKISTLFKPNGKYEYWNEQIETFKNKK